MIHRIRLSIAIALSAALLLGAAPSPLPAAAVAQEATACAPPGSLPQGISLSFMACRLAAPPGGPPSMIAVDRQRFGPGAALSPQQTTQDRLLYVEQGELFIAGDTYPEGASVVVRARDTFGLRNDTSEEASLLSVDFIRIQAAGGSGPEAPPRVGSADAAGRLIQAWTAPPTGEPVLFLAAMRLAPGAGIGAISHPGPVGLVVETGALTVEHYASGFTPGSGHRGQRAAIGRGQSLFLAGNTTYRAWNDSGVTTTVLLAGAVAAERPLIEASPGTLAFGARSNGQWDVFAYDLGNAAITPLAADPGSDQWAPAYSHDGGRLAYLSDTGGSNQVWVMPANGGDARRVTDYAGPGQIRFVAWDAGDYALILSVDTGSESMLLRAPLEWDGTPVTIAAPAGFASVDYAGMMAYVTQPSGDYSSSTIAVENPWLGTTTYIPASGAPADAPNFSASGTWLAYQVGEPPTRYIEIIPLNGGAPRGLTGGVDASNPVWSPDGQAVAFVAARNRQPSIWIQAIEEWTPVSLDLPPFERVWYLTWRR